MSDRLLQFAHVVAGRDRHGIVHVYYGKFYVGAISHSGSIWSARLHDILLGEFDSLDAAKMVVAEWYYGAGAAPGGLNARSVGGPIPTNGI